MPKHYGWIIGILLCVVAGVLHAQAVPTQQAIVVRAADARLDEEAIRQAMQPLLARGLRVAVYLVQNGGSSDFRARREADGLGGEFVDEDVIALYAAIDTRYSEVIWGARYHNLMLNLNLRRSVMNLYLRDNLFTEAFVKSLEAIEAVLATPPTPVPISAPVENPSTAADTSINALDILFAFTPHMIGLGLLLWVISKFSGRGTGDGMADSGWSSGGWSSDSGGSSGGSGGSDGGSWSD